MMLNQGIVTVIWYSWVAWESYNVCFFQLSALKRKCAGQGFLSLSESWVVSKLASPISRRGELGCEIGGEVGCAIWLMWFGVGVPSGLFFIFFLKISIVEPSVLGTFALHLSSLSTDRAQVVACSFYNTLNNRRLDMTKLLLVQYRGHVRYNMHMCPMVITNFCSCVRHKSMFLKKKKQNYCVSKHVRKWCV